MWADGSTSMYRNWRVGEPNDGSGSEECGNIYADGKWNDLPCNDNENCYYCSVIGKKCLQFMRLICLFVRIVSTDFTRSVLYFLTDLLHFI